MQINFDLVHKGFADCTTRCSQWKTMNEIVFLLHQAISNNDITLLQSPCKIEDQANISNPNQEDNNDIIVPIPSNQIRLEKIMSLAMEEYEFILKGGWKGTILDTSDQSQYFVCAGCRDNLKVLGYTSPSDALLNGVDQGTIDTMTSTNCISGYFGCQCRYHLKCLLKRICSGLTIKKWRCDWHSKQVVTFFVSNNCGFPDKKYIIPNIEEHSTYLEKLEQFSVGTKRHLTLVQKVCQEFKIHFGSVMLSIERNI